MSDFFPAYRAAGQIVEVAESTSTLDLEPIVRLMGSSYALLFRVRVADEHVEDAKSHGVDGGYVSRLREAGRERMLPGWLSQLEPGSVIDRALFGSDQQFARTAFYNHVIRPEGRFHCVIATPLRSRSHGLHLVVGRPRNRPGFEPDDVRLIRSLLPLVNEVLQARAASAQSEANARAAFGISEAWAYPVLVADVKGVVQYANRGGRHLLATSEHLLVDAASTLRSGTRAGDHKLRQAFAAALRTGDRQTVTLEAGTGPGLRLTVRRTGPACVNERESSPAWVVVTAEEQGRDVADQTLAAVRRRYGLTQRELDLLSCLVQGINLKETSRRLGMSYNTGRFHLRQIFAKTETHRQSDLVRRCVTGFF